MLSQGNREQLTLDELVLQNNSEALSVCPFDCKLNSV